MSVVPGPFIPVISQNAWQAPFGLRCLSRFLLSHHRGTCATLSLFIRSRFARSHTVLPFKSDFSVFLGLNRGIAHSGQFADAGLGCSLLCIKCQIRRRLARDALLPLFTRVPMRLLQILRMDKLCTPAKDFQNPDRHNSMPAHTEASALSPRFALHFASVAIPIAHLAKIFSFFVRHFASCCSCGPCSGSERSGHASVHISAPLTV